MLGEMAAVYHFGWDDLLEMEVTWFCKLYGRIPVIDARRMLAWLPIHTYPHILEDKDRRRLFDRLVRQARVTKTQDATQIASGWERLKSVSQGAQNGEDE